MQNWDRPLDKGPQVDEPRERHQHPKRRDRRRKVFIIERRYVGKPITSWLKRFFSREWHVYRRYTNGKSRNQALANLTRKAKAEAATGRGWEYRAA